jgi:DNA-directed RNA polymerase subunit M/transcription elongation factor TFIIS
MLRDFFCPRCKKLLGTHFDEGEPLLASCSTCGARAQFTEPWSQSESWALTYHAGLLPTARESQEAEIAHSALTYRQRCGQRLTDGG